MGSNEEDYTLVMHQKTLGRESFVPPAVESQEESLWISRGDFIIVIFIIFSRVLYIIVQSGYGHKVGHIR